MEVVISVNKHLYCLTIFFVKYTNNEFSLNKDGKILELARNDDVDLIQLSKCHKVYGEKLT